MAGVPKYGRNQTGLVWGTALLFCSAWSIWRLMCRWHICRFRYQPWHAVVFLLGLGAILVLPLARMALLKSNVQSEKQSFPNTNLDHPLGKLVATYNFAASPFLHYILLALAAKVADSYAAQLLAKQQTQLGRTLVPSCQYNFNSGILASGKTRIPLQDGWRRTWQMCQWPRNVESIIRKAKLPQHKPGSPWENGKLVATYNFAASPFLHCMISTLVAVPKLRFLRSCFLCREHSLEEHSWHVASTTSTVASLRVARLGWLPSQAKRHGTAKLWHWSWNVKSTIS